MRYLVGNLQVLGRLRILGEEIFALTKAKPRWLRYVVYWFIVRKVIDLRMMGGVDEESGNALRGSLT